MLNIGVAVFWGSIATSDGLHPAIAKTNAKVKKNGEKYALFMLSPKDQIIQKMDSIINRA
jgi:hypothetical protein